MHATPLPAARASSRAALADVGRVSSAEWQCQRKVEKGQPVADVFLSRTPDIGVPRRVGQSIVKLMVVNDEMEDEEVSVPAIATVYEGVPGKFSGLSVEVVSLHFLTDVFSNRFLIARCIPHGVRPSYGGRGGKAGGRHTSCRPSLSGAAS